jgi:hypothetical protein
MNARSYIYTLKDDIKGNPRLSYDLGLQIISEDTKYLELSTPKGPVKLDKFEYMNKFKVFDNGSVFFVVCNKQANADYVFDFLLNYAINKIDTRVDFLHNLKQRYRNLLNQRKGLIAAA